MNDLVASGLTKGQAQQALRKMRAERNDVIHNGKPVQHDTDPRINRGG